MARSQVQTDTGSWSGIPGDAVLIAGLAGGTVPIGARAIEQLGAAVGGKLLAPGAPGWQDAVQLWNGMTARQPALVVQPGSTAEVAGAVSFAREHRLLLGIKGGGHNIAGTAIPEGGLLLDMSRLRGVVVDAARRRVHVEPGCRLRDVDRVTQQHGLAVPLGFISNTGVAGLTLGGGLGYLTRRFGWTVDNLEEVEIVTGDGQVRVANREREAELFWAVRGAGANFGAATRFTFRAHAIGPTVYGGLIAWPFERAAEVVAVYRELIARAPRELAAWLVLLHAPPAPFVPDEWRGRKVCAFAVCYTGDIAASGDVLAPLRSLGAPLFDLLHPQPFTEVQSYLDETEPTGLHHYWKTEFAPGLSDGLAAALLDSYAACDVPEGEIGLLHIGGALNERPEDDGAVGNRDAHFAIGIKAMWPARHPGAEAIRGWVRAAWAQVRPFSTGRTYINFQGADEDEARVRATYGANFARLGELKARYDPDNLFRSNRNIRPGG